MVQKVENIGGDCCSCCVRKQNQLLVSQLLIGAGNRTEAQLGLEFDIKVSMENFKEISTH